MAEFGFKQLTLDNWLEPDLRLSALSHYPLHSLRDGSNRPATCDMWARAFLAVDLGEHVPLEVRRLFAVARGALLYGCFFYPHYTLGAEQLLRVAEAAVGHKCRQLGVPEAKLEKMRFQQRVAHLVADGVIPLAAQEQWEICRELRNMASHPADQASLPPGIAIGGLRTTAADIDRLFKT